MIPELGHLAMILALFWVCLKPVSVQRLRTDPLLLATAMLTINTLMNAMTSGDLQENRSVFLMLGLLLMDAGLFKWTVANDLEKLPQQGRRWWDYPRRFLRNAGGMLLTNALLFGVLAALGHAWLYGVWVLAYITPFPLLVRIRSIAEHGMLERVPDMFRNTRSTRAGILMRLLVAPCHVNYHLEHHAMASVPYYRLPRLHRLMRERNAVPPSPGYAEVLRMASSGG